MPIREHFRLAKIAAIVCVLALLVIAVLFRFIPAGNSIGPFPSVPLTVSLVFASVGIVALLLACWHYAKSKGYSGFLGLFLPLLRLPGLAILVLLKDRHPDGKPIALSELAPKTGSRLEVARTIAISIFVILAIFGTARRIASNLPDPAPSASTTPPLAPGYVRSNLSPAILDRLVETGRVDSRTGLGPHRAVIEGFSVVSGQQQPLTIRYSLERKCSWLERSETSLEVQQDGELVRVNAVSSVEESFDHSIGREQWYSETALLAHGNNELLARDISVFQATKMDSVVKIDTEKPETKTYFTNVPAMLRIESYLYERAMLSRGEYAFSYYALNLDSPPDTSTIERVEITPVTSSSTALFRWLTKSYRFDAEGEALDSEYVAVTDDGGTELYGKMVEADLTLEVWLKEYEELDAEVCQSQPAPDNASTQSNQGKRA